MKKDDPLSVKKSDTFTSSKYEPILRPIKQHVTSTKPNIYRLDLEPSKNRMTVSQFKQWGDKRFPNKFHDDPETILQLEVASSGHLLLPLLDFPALSSQKVDNAADERFE